MNTKKISCEECANVNCHLKDGMFDLCDGRKFVRKELTTGQKLDKVATQLFNEKKGTLQRVPVYEYYEDGDKVKKKVTGYAEIVPREVVQIDNLPFEKEHHEPVIWVKSTLPTINRNDGELNLRATRKARHRVYRDVDPRLVPETAYSHDRTEDNFGDEEMGNDMYIDDLEIIVTRKQRKERSNRKEAKRREIFMDNHGFKLKQKLQDMQLRSPVKAKQFAEKLTMDDWMAINQAGGLASA